MLIYSIRYFLFRVLRKSIYLILIIAGKKISIEELTGKLIAIITKIKTNYKIRIGNHILEYHLNTDIGFMLFFFGSFEQNELLICRKYLSEESIILDIGANIGIHSLYFSSVAEKGSIFAFEPSRRTFRLLSENVESVRNIIPLNLGLSNESKLLEFYETSDNAYSSLKDTERKPVLFKSKILCYKFDDLLEQLQIGRLDFVKIDVEGLEQEVLEGMSNTLKKFRPIVFCEIYRGTNSNPDPNRTINTMVSIGYDPFVIDGASIVPFEVHSDLFQNYVFIPC